MARIKFLQEDFAGFRPDRVVKEYQLRPDQITTPAEAIQTIRQGVQLGKEVADAGVGFADFLTKAGAIGKQPTKESLMNEAAKRRAEMATGVAAKERQKIVGEQQAVAAEQAKLEQAGGPDYSRSAMGLVGVADKTRQDLVAKIIPEFQSGKVSAEDLQKQLDFALSANAISAEEKKAIEDQIASGRLGLQKAREAEAAAKAGVSQTAAAREQVIKQQQAAVAQQTQAEAKAKEEAAKYSQINTRPEEVRALAQSEGETLALDKQLLEELKAKPVDSGYSLTKKAREIDELETSIRLREEFIKELNTPNPDPAKLQQLQKDYQEQVAKTQQVGQEATAAQLKAQQEQAAAEARAKQAEQEAAKAAAAERQVAAPKQTTADINAIVANLPEAKAEQFYIEAMSVPTMERTKTEQDLIAAVSKRFPQFVERFKGREGELSANKAAYNVAENFRAGIANRKTAIEQSVKLDEEQKQQQLANIDKALAALDADPEKASGEFTRAIKAINDARGKKQKGPVQSKEELQQERDELVSYLGGGVARKQELDQQEEARTAAVERASTAVLAGIAELQVLNDKRAKTGALTPDEAARVIQLKKYIGDTKQLQEKLMTADVANNPNIKQFVLDITQNFNEGKVPVPETKQMREQRFNEELTAFDAETAKLIKDEAVKAAAEIKNNYIDADQLRLLAVKAALSGKKEDAAVVLGALYEGKVVGMQPSSFVDWLSGDYKKRFNNEIFQTLFTRVRGKSDEEIAIALQNLELKNINTIRQVAETLTNLDKKAQDLKEKKETEADRAAKVKAEAETAKSQQTIKAFEADKKFLDERYKKLVGEAETASQKGIYAEQQEKARLRLSSAMASYYAGRNQAAMRVAQAGETAAALNAGGKNFDDYANDVGKMQGKDQTNYDKYSQFEKYVGSDGKFNQNYYDEFGSGTAGEKEKQKGMNTAQKEAFMKRLGAVKEYQDRWTKGSVLTNEAKNNRDAVYGKVIGTTRILATLLQGGKIKRDDKDAANKIGRVLEEQKKVQAIVDGLAAGKYKTETEKKEALDKLDEAVKKAEEAVK